ncbi:MAG: hypothetical protein PHY25_03265 [Dehalococcoidales bacterium]|nr:hypothetical protein [Dehalococcoidales bacterium]
MLSISCLPKFALLMNFLDDDSENILDLDCLTGVSYQFDRR